MVCTSNDCVKKDVANCGGLQAKCGLWVMVWYLCLCLARTLKRRMMMGHSMFFQGTSSITCCFFIGQNVVHGPSCGPSP